MAEKMEKADSITSSTPSQSWKGWLWDSADVSKEERRFLLKVGSALRILQTSTQSNSNSLLIARFHSIDIRYSWNADQMGKGITSIVAGEILNLIP